MAASPLWGSRQCLMVLAGWSERNCVACRFIEADKLQPRLLSNLCVIESRGHQRETVLPPDKSPRHHCIRVCVWEKERQRQNIYSHVFMFLNRSFCNSSYLPRYECIRCEMTVCMWRKRNLIQAQKYPSPCLYSWVIPNLFCVTAKLAHMPPHRCHSASAAADSPPKTGAQSHRDVQSGPVVVKQSCHCVGIKDRERQSEARGGEGEMLRVRIRYEDRDWEKGNTLPPPVTAPTVSEVFLLYRCADVLLLMHSFVMEHVFSEGLKMEVKGRDREFQKRTTGYSSWLSCLPEGDRLNCAAL